MKRAMLTQEQAIFSGQDRRTGENSIIRSIEHHRAVQRDYCLRAESLAVQAESYLLMANDDSFDEAQKAIYHNHYKEAKGESDGLFKKANRKDERLKILGHKLAAFRTGLLSFTNDSAMV